MIAYRGVKTPAVTRIVAGWRRDHQLSSLPDQAQLALAASLIATIASLVGERERFIQTGIGWVISDLSKAHPDRAAALVERHFDDLSAEVIRRHTKYLAQHGGYKARKRR